MQDPTSEGLLPAQPQKRRCTVFPIKNGNHELVESLIATWRYRTPKEAHAVLAQDDVTVTNTKDKVLFLPKVLMLNDEVIESLSSLPLATGATASELV